jgi:hypothetical protein
VIEKPHLIEQEQIVVPQKNETIVQAQAQSQTLAAPTQVPAENKTSDSVSRAEFMNWMSHRISADEVVAATEAIQQHLPEKVHA